MKKEMDKIQFEYRYEVQELMKVIDKFVGTKKKVQKCIDKISGQGEREWGVDIDIKKALPYTWEKKVKKTHW